ncbi:dipeptide/oligopeptide/nickel ABC transporter permease/ATP-binding protein [Corynebacterium hindlerae]|uniref:ABC transporter permease subunit n=1 Tax=Corynebacterium hindlerae TaxID=699041 RepID=UPI001AD6E3BF|nr:dipeptide/oligopeptide/nickel ABC transporter permease/ATP-binding protein [Corynebacterium hindlerae]QTH58927.1 dipeptide/oligopeptide/nickel ABC transporter permease/ATP-binding protein [Corynebacterium hindlerae]
MFKPRLGASLFVLVLLYALLVPALLDQGSPSFATALQAPSGEHWWGTDHFGFDLFVRTAQALRVSLLIGLLSALLATALGVVVGLSAATLGGWVDRVIMRLTDAINSIPHMILSVVIVALFQGSIPALIISIGITHWAPVARIIRSTVLSVRASDFVDASYGAGARPRWILRRHYFPAALSQAVVAITMLMPHAVWHESALSFLGLGIQPNEPSLGTLMDLAREDIMKGAWWSLVFPGIVLLLTTISAMSLMRKKDTTARDCDADLAVAAEVPDTGVAGLTVTADDGTTLVHDATLELTPGQVHGLVGASGSGKSTLGRALLGAIPPGCSVTGTISVAGERLTECESAAATRKPGASLSALRGSNVSFVPQSAATSFTPVRRIGPQLAELSTGRHTVPELLELVHLTPDIADYFPHQLSGGMMQRVAIAGALAGDPQVIVADEPTSALDPDLTLEILALLREIADSGTTVLLITHDIEDLIHAGICHHISVMHHGEIIEHGPHVLDNPTHPYTKALLAALPSGGLRLTKEFVSG